MSSREQLIHAYSDWLKALNHGNVQAISKLVADTVVHNGKTHSDHTYPGYISENLAAFSAHTIELDMLTVDVPARAIAARLIHRGTLQRPAFGILVTGNATEWSEHVLNWLDTDNKISRVETLFEMDALRAGLAEVPRMPTVQPAAAPSGFDIKTMYRNYVKTSLTARENLHKFCQSELTHNLHVCSLDEFRGFIDNTCKQIEGFKVTIIELITDEVAQHVAARIELSGKPVAEFAGIPPTGKEMRFPEHAYYKLSEGKIIHYWGQGDLDTYKKCLEG